MRKILIYIFLCFLPFASYSGGLCVRPGVSTVILNPVVAPTSVTTNTDNLTWTANFNYGIVKGTAAICSGSDCMKTPGNLVPQSQIGISYANGSVCVCKMTSPVESLWVSSGTWAQNSGMSGCVSACKGVLDDSTKAKKLLGGMFENIVLP